MPGIPPTPSVLLLPFYFWAAARFGVGGVSAALFATAFAASYETQIGHRPFDVLPPAESLMAVQMYLIVMGIPLMCVAGLLDERRAGEANLKDRLRFEGLLATIASDFVRQPLDLRVQRRPAATSASSSMSTTWAFCKWARPAASCTSSGSGAAVRARRLAGIKCVESFPAAFGVVLAGEPSIADTPDDVPPEATVDREAFRRFGMQAAAVLPLLASGSVQGALSLATMRPGHRPGGICRGCCSSPRFSPTPVRAGGRDRGRAGASEARIRGAFVEHGRAHGLARAPVEPAADRHSQQRGGRSALHRFRARDLAAAARHPRGHCRRR